MGTASGSAVLCLSTPLALEARQAGTVCRIGVLEILDEASNTANLGAFRQGLAELGYVEGQNVVMEYRSADGRPERFSDLATELVRLKMDVIVTRGTGATLTAKHVTRTIPIVMASSGDPVLEGIVASLARPGGNVTGLHIMARPELGGRRLQLLRRGLHAGRSYRRGGRSPRGGSRGWGSPNTLDPFTLVLLGYAYLSAERLADASRCAHQALIGCPQQTRRNVEAHALHLVGAFASRQEPLVLEDAMQHYRQALALAGELGMRPLAAHCHLSLGKLYHKTGQTGQAREHLTTATTMYREMLMTYWLEKSETGVKELE